MPLFNCCSATLIGRKKKDKGDGKNRITKLQVKLENPLKSSEQKEPNTAAVGVSVSFNIPKNSRSRAKVVNHESPINREEVEVAYEGEDECDDRSPIWRDNSESNLQEFQFQNINITPTDQSGFFSPELNQSPKSKKTRRDHHEGVDAVQSGHLSDPGTTKRLDDWDSPKLKRSCSNLETSELLKKIADQLPPTKSKSFNQLQHLAEKADEAAHLPGTPCSHTSAFTHFSADKVILRKTSSSQVLPSRSRRLWWKLFLWSHRNLQKPSSPKPRKPTTLVSQNQQGGYSSDTLEPSWTKKLSKTGLLSPGAISEEHLQEDSTHYKEDCHASGWDRFQSGISGSWPQNQWLAFDMHSSPMKRVDEWVMNLEIQPADFADEIEKNNEVDNKGKGIVVPTPMTGRSTAGSIAHSAKYQARHITEDVLHANSVVQSLNSSSTVAHISGMGLKVIPSISPYLRLRSVNLSNNCIAHITSGSLPKSLHNLNLSRNKITTIEGLKELTRLRVLDLSYNRISRIGQGLSNCTLLKELYLAGNKISEVEGLHRLLKLTLLDLSFNKIPTTKALGQLVANYNSLVALNLLGNPIQSTLSDDQLRKAVCGLLPKLAYLNKQPINQQKAREVATEIIAKASSGRGKRHGRKKPSRKGGYGGGSASGAVHV